MCRTKSQTIHLLLKDAHALDILHYFFFYVDILKGNCPADSYRNGPIFCQSDDEKPAHRVFVIISVRISKSSSSTTILVVRVFVEDIGHANIQLTYID